MGRDRYGVVAARTTLHSLYCGRIHPHHHRSSLPVLPYATAKVWAQLGLGDIEQAAKNGELNNLEWGGLKPGTKLGELGPIFPARP